jgi:predicted dehydrogenase
VSLRFRAAEPRAERGGYRVDGTQGSVLHEGGSLGGSSVLVVTGSGDAAREEVVDIGADWFGPGLAGTMGELLGAVEEGRPARHDARTALPGLALCFAALQSAGTGMPVVPGSVRRRPRLDARLDGVDT